MNVLVLGGGGREHALAWGIAKSSLLDTLLCAPGNAGTGRLGENISLDPCDAAAVLALCRRRGIDLVVIGPEAPLVAGVGDALRSAGVAVFGPGAAGARLEGSKAFCKEFLTSVGVPTARHVTVDSLAQAERAFAELGERVAVKADGLAAGKGVVMAANRTEALDAVRSSIDERAFGAAGARVVLEEWLEGEEASLIAFVDGEEVRPLVPSQDHKRAYDGDEGPNTGGMGAYAPFPRLAGEAVPRAVESCILPLARGLAQRGIDFRGVLYAGLMLTERGPQVLEFNVRFGDPETQAILPLFDGDLLAVLAATARGELAQLPPLRVRSGAALTVVAASAGYPASSDKGREISGLEGDDDRGDVIVFHAGTARRDDGAIVTAGGRVLGVTGLGDTLASARERAYAALADIRFEGMFHRSDIGARSLGAASPGRSS